MRDIPAALLAHLGLEVTTLATCWQLTRKDSTVFRYTDHDDDLVVDGGTYRADTGFTRSAVDFKITLAVNNSDITGIFNSKRGRVLGMEASPHGQLIRVAVPEAEILNFSTELRSITGGRGSFTMKFSHYEEVPTHIAQKIVEQTKKEKEEAEK